MMPEIEFVNRAYELDLICKPGAPRFIVIDGAAGYGKTDLLGKVKEKYQEDRRAWKVALIDLKGDPQFKSVDLAVAGPCIANAIIQQFHQTQAPTVPIGADQVAISNILVRFLVEQIADVLLLFDGIEVLQPNTSAWLKGLVGDLDHGLREIGPVEHELRVIFAGRYVGGWGRGAPYAVFTLSLSSFDRVAVRNMVEDVARSVGALAPGYLAELTWWVLYLSGGHPQGICNILELLVKEGFRFADLRAIFLSKWLQRNGQRFTIFELCIQPIIEEILQDVPMSLCKILAVISPIRRFDQELLDELQEQGIISVPEYSSSWKLIQALLQTRLISPPTDNPMFSDQIVRRMLAVQMQLQDPDYWQQINECALRIFDKWALGRDLVKGETRRIAILESLYHALQLESLGRQATEIEIQERLEQKLCGHLKGTQDFSDVYQLQFTLNKDQELNDLIERRAGSGAIQALLDVINKRLPLDERLP